MPASLIARKDPLTLIRAAAEVRRAVPHLQICVAGSLADEPYVRRVRQEIAVLGLDGVVSLPGSLPAERLQQEYSQAEIVVLPSRQESAPLAIVEAMAAGIPVVASAVGGVPDMVEDGITGFQVPPGDPGALARALTLSWDILNEPVRWAPLRRSPHKHASTQHTLRPDYLDLYREAASFPTTR